jgi:hypothetical protein
MHIASEHPQKNTKQRASLPFEGFVSLIMEFDISYFPLKKQHQQSIPMAVVLACIWSRLAALSALQSKEGDSDSLWNQNRSSNCRQDRSYSIRETKSSTGSQERYLRDNRIVSISAVSGQKKKATFRHDERQCLSSEDFTCTIATVRRYTTQLSSAHQRFEESRSLRFHTSPS